MRLRASATATYGSFITACWQGGRERSTWSLTAWTTDGGVWPAFSTPRPPVKSMKRLPSTSSRTAPWAAAAYTGVMVATPLATACRRRRSRASLSGPGTSPTSFRLCGKLNGNTSSSGRRHPDPSGAALRSAPRTPRGYAQAPSRLRGDQGHLHVAGGQLVQEGLGRDGVLGGEHARPVDQLGGQELGDDARGHAGVELAGAGLPGRGDRKGNTPQ